jgi:hypothetical protein
MKILVTLSGGDDGPEITIGRHTPTMAETEHALFSQICNVVEPAIYEAIRQCVRENLFTTATCFWDGTKIIMRKG